MSGVICNVFLLAAEHHKVFRPVVVLVPVDVMDHLSRPERSAQHLFGYDTVFMPPVVFRVCAGFTWAFVHLLAPSDGLTFLLGPSSTGILWSDMAACCSGTGGFDSCFRYFPLLIHGIISLVVEMHPCAVEPPSAYSATK